ncbi:hypothetical protein NFJ02_14g15770 [Pycnococcus provasolii]
MYLHRWAHLPVGSVPPPPPPTAPPLVITPPVIRLPTQDEKVTEIQAHEIILPNRSYSNSNGNGNNNGNSNSANNDEPHREGALQRYNTLQPPRVPLGHYHQYHMDVPPWIMAEMETAMRFARRASRYSSRSKLEFYPDSSFGMFRGLNAVIKAIQAHFKCGDFVRAQLNLNSFYHHPHWDPKTKGTLTIVLSVGAPAWFLWCGRIYLIKAGTLLTWTEEQQEIHGILTREILGFDAWNEWWNSLSYDEREQEARASFAMSFKLLPETVTGGGEGGFL